MLVSKPLVHPTSHLVAPSVADHSLPLGLLTEQEVPVPGLTAAMREAQEVEISGRALPLRRRFASANRLNAISRILSS